MNISETIRDRAIALSSDVDADTLHHYFDDKVAGVRASTDDADSPTFTPAPVGCELRLFTPVSLSEVTEMSRKLPDKECTNDPLPTWLLKQSVEVLAPFLCRVFNWSLENGTVPSIFKSAYIAPLLKKADLDPAEPKSFRPISISVCHLEAAGTTGQQGASSF